MTNFNLPVLVFVAKYEDLKVFLLLINIFKTTQCTVHQDRTKASPWLYPQKTWCGDSDDERHLVSNYYRIYIKKFIVD